MIMDRIENLKSYFTHDLIMRAADFIASLTPDMKDGEYALMGKDLFAKVMTYETRTHEQAVLEAHRKYIDIQAVITGSEGIEWHPASGLKIKIPYDAANDVEFFVPPGRGIARVDISNGVCAVFYPQDAHMPQLIAGGGSEMIKKVVVKVRVEAIFNP